MTTEEKAKAYDEALEQAKKELKVCGSLDCDAARQIFRFFPQLRESEDERIRKGLIEALKTSKTVGELKFVLPYPTREECIAYLEKMKEQNGEDEECIDFTIYHPLKNGEGKYKCIPYSFYGSLTSFSEDKDLIDFLRTCFYTKEECNEWIEKQKEQKPAEWDDYTKTNLDRALQIIKNAKGNLQGYQSDDGIYECDKAIECLEHFLYRGLEIEKPADEQFPPLEGLDAIKAKYYDYGFKNGFDEGVESVKPAEWSEEDKKHINPILRILDRQQCWDGATGKKCNPYQDEIDWLKSLCPQPKQEWSEEDERILKGIIGKIDHDQTYGVSKAEMLSFLKSLRPVSKESLQPHWKPSEDEERLINTSISFLKDFADKGYENAVECIDWLKSKLNGNTCE